MAESEALNPADIAILAAGLASGSVGVRAATVEALSRLPLTAADWRAVGRYAQRVLAGGGSVAERQAVIEVSPSIPLRSVRDQVAGFVDSPDPELSWRATAAVRAMGHASTVPAILALPVGDSDLYRIALTDISGTVAAVRAEFGARPAGSEDRFWLALALALSGEDAELRATVEHLAQPQRPDWNESLDYRLREVIAARRLPESTALWLAEPAARIPADLVTALTVRPDLAWYYSHRVGTVLRPGWSDGQNPGFSTRDDPGENEVREADELYAWISETYLAPWGAEEMAEELVPRVRSVESRPAIVSRLMERASWTGYHSSRESYNIVVLVGLAQGRFRPDVAGLFETYREVMVRSWWDERTIGFDEVSVRFGRYDDEGGGGGPRSFCLQIGWIVSRGGLPGLVPALAADLRSADPRTRIAATYLIADAAAYVTEAIAPQFGGGSDPGREAAWELVDEPDEDETLPERHVVAAVLDSGGVPPTGPLVQGLRYLLRFTIGADLVGDLVRGAPPFPVAQLPPSIGGWWLTVAVHGEDVDIPAGLHAIFLPTEGPAWTCRCRPDGPHLCQATERGKAIELPFRAPNEAVIAAAVVKVYWGATLVQAIEMMLPVGEVGSGLAPAATVVYTLGPALEDVVHRAPRDLSVLHEPGRARGHVLHVNGTSGTPVVFELSDAAAAESARHLRSLLFDSHLVREGERWTTRYGQRHETDRRTYAEDLRRLAVAGAELFVGLFGGRGAQVQAELADAGRRTGRPAELQVARAVNTRLTVPWQLVYDLPIDDARTPGECRSVAEFGPGGPVPHVPPVCPHADTHDRSGTLCPFGFWGLAHHVECPPPTFAKALPELTGDDSPADLIVALHPDLATGAWMTHDRALRRLGARPAVQDVAALRASLLLGADVLYFDCHGARVVRAGSNAPRPVIDMGRGGQLSPLTLDTWGRGDPQVRWERRRPLVVLNGCHTGELLPDVPAELVTAFIDGLGAAGVVATEIAVEATLAATAMEQFLGELVAGRSVGAAMRSMRWALLARGNVLGLAYAADCDSRLRLPDPERSEREESA